MFYFIINHFILTNQFIENYPANLISKELRDKKMLLNAEIIMDVVVEKKFKISERLEVLIFLVMNIFHFHFKISKNGV